MTNAEIRTAIGNARTAFGRATTEKTKLEERRRNALTAERLDQHYVDSLKRQIEVCDLEITNATERIDALVRLLPNATETDAAKTKTIELTQQAESARVARLCSR